MLYIALPGIPYVDCLWICKSDKLLEAKQLSEKEQARVPDARRVISEETVNRIMARYTRDRGNRGKALNLLPRLDTRPCEIMGFFALPEAGVAYDNN